MLQIKDLTIKLKNSDKLVLENLNLQLEDGKILALSGKNGSGKSTLAQSIMGNPSFEIVSGEIIFNDIVLNNLTPDERSKLGIFLAFQTPIEIPGISLFEYLKLIYNTHHSEKLSVFHFRQLLKEKFKIVGLTEAFLDRNLNEGFSGGERKKCEILQMLLIEPKLIILDEIDSGIDKFGIEMVINIIRNFKSQNESEVRPSIILISHYEKLISEIGVDNIIIL